MVESRKIKKETSNFKEAICLGLDIVERGSSMMLIGGMFYLVPNIAALRLLLKPHDLINFGHLVYDVGKLAYLIGKGVICKLIQVKNCILALRQKAATPAEAKITENGSVVETSVHDQLK